MKKNLLTVSLWGIYLLFLSCRPASNRQAVYNFAPLDSITVSYTHLDVYKRQALFVAFCIEEYGAAKGMMDDHVLF